MKYPLKLLQQLNFREHQWTESRRQKEIVEAEKAKKKKERDQKKEDELRAQEQKQGQEGGGQGAEEGKDKPKENGHVAAPEVPDFPPEVHLTERQRLAIQTKKEQEEREKQKKVDIIKSQAGKMSNNSMLH